MCICDPPCLSLPLLLRLCVCVGLCVPVAWASARQSAPDGNRASWSSRASREAGGVACLASGGLWCGDRCWWPSGLPRVHSRTVLTAAAPSARSFRAALRRLAPKSKKINESANGLPTWRCEPVPACTSGVPGRRVSAPWLCRMKCQRVVVHRPHSRPWGPSRCLAGSRRSSLGPPGPRPQLFPAPALNVKAQVAKEVTGRELAVTSPCPLVTALREPAAWSVPLGWGADAPCGSPAVSMCPVFP